MRPPRHRLRHRRETRSARAATDRTAAARNCRTPGKTRRNRSPPRRHSCAPTPATTRRAPAPRAARSGSKRPRRRCPARLRAHRDQARRAGRSRQRHCTRPPTSAPIAFGEADGLADVVPPILRPQPAAVDDAAGDGRDKPRVAVAGAATALRAVRPARRGSGPSRGCETRSRDRARGRTRDRRQARRRAPRSPPHHPPRSPSSGR